MQNNDKLHPAAIVFLAVTAACTVGGGAFTITHVPDPYSRGAVAAALIIEALLPLISGVFFALTLYFSLHKKARRSVRAAAAAGMLLTELISGGAAILVQFVLWFIPLLRGSGMLWGNISRFTLICRHNSLFYREQFITHMGAFVFSRIFYILISLILVLLTVLVYELKRGGRFNGVRLFGESGILRRKA